MVSTLHAEQARGTKTATASVPRAHRLTGTAFLSFKERLQSTKPLLVQQFVARSASPGTHDYAHHPP